MCFDRLINITDGTKHSIFRSVHDPYYKQDHTFSFYYENEEL